MKQLNDATDHFALIFVVLIGLLALAKTLEMQSNIQERRNQAIQRLK
jgi:hypothetical protein